MTDVTVYGADWCGDTRRALAYLDDQGISYVYRNVDTDNQALVWVQEQNEGKRKLPTILIGDQVLSVPASSEIEDALRSKGAIA